MKSITSAIAVAALTAATLGAGISSAEAQTPTRWRMHSAYAKPLPVAGGHRLQDRRYR